MGITGLALSGRCASKSARFVSGIPGTLLAQMANMMSVIPPIALALLAVSACAGQAEYIGPTKIPRTEENERILQRVEEYRLAVEQRDAGKLLAMADPEYWEDSGTPTGADDYGYDRLREVLTGRFQAAESIRYSLRYMKISRRAGRAYVDVLIDASYSLKDARGRDVREDKRDQNQLLLRWDENRKAWLFTSGY
jgi:hypothetical protein